MEWWSCLREGCGWEGAQPRQEQARDEAGNDLWIARCRVCPMVLEITVGSVPAWWNEGLGASEPRFGPSPG